MPDLNLLLNLLKEFAWLGNWLFFTLAFIESAPFIGLFIPGATLIYVGGIIASQGALNTWDIIVFATIGAIIGDFFSYLLGRWGGNWIKDKKIINQSLLNKGEYFFLKYGNKSVFWGRFFGPVRAIIPFIAGLSKMKKAPFVFWNILSATGWAMLNVFTGYFSGTIIVTIFKKWSSKLSWLLFISLIIFIIYWVFKYHGQSIITYFKIKSLKFYNWISSKNWFNKLTNRYPFTIDFFNESKNATEKLYGVFLLSLFFLFLYLVIIIIDVF